MILLIYLMVLALLQTFKITSNLSPKDMKLSLTIHQFKFIQMKRIVFKIKTGYKLELLTPETMRLSGSGKKEIEKDEGGKNVPKLESVEVVLVHFNLVKNDYQHTSKVLFTFVLIWTNNKYFITFFNNDEHS